MNSKDAAVNPPPAPARVEALPAELLLRSHLWVYWTRIAIQHEGMAKAARQEL